MFEYKPCSISRAVRLRIDFATICILCRAEHAHVRHNWWLYSSSHVASSDGSDVRSGEGTEIFDASIPPQAAPVLHITRGDRAACKKEHGGRDSFEHVLREKSVVFRKRRNVNVNKNKQ